MGYPDSEPFYKAVDVIRFYDRCPERLFKQMRNSLMVLCAAEKLHNQKAELELKGLFNRGLNATAVKEIFDEYNHVKTPYGNWRTLGWF